MKEIALSNGMICLVDDHDYEWASLYKWHAVTSSNPKWERKAYAYRRVFSKRIGKIDGKRARIQINALMHRELLDAPKGIQVDHHNGNGLDNRRENLRLADQGQQAQNSMSQRGSTSVFKGVSWHTKRGQWRAVIKKDGKATHLLYSHDEEAAARAYDAAAIVAFGEYACLNFPTGEARRARRRA